MHPPDFPPFSKPVRPIRARAIAVVVMLGVGAVVDLLSLVVTFERASLISALVDSPESVDTSVVDTNDYRYALCAIAQAAAYVLTGIVFLIWLYRARLNAEAITPIPHRRSTGLVVFGWVIPIVNLWFPKQIVDDIWVTSTSQEPPLNPLRRIALQSARRSGLVRAWWTSWLVAFWGSSFFYRVARGEDLDSQLLLARTEIYFAAPTLVCAVLAVLVVVRITQAQERRRPVAVPAA